MLCTAIHAEGVQADEEFARLAVGFPLAAMMPSRFFSNWLHMDQSHVVGAITVTGVYVTHNMDVMVEKALSLDGWDRLVVLEHDMIPPLDALNRIACYRPQHHIVGSMYFGHQPPHPAHALMEKPGPKYDPISAAQTKQWCDDPQLYEVDAVGFGLTSIARHVLEDWVADVEMFDTDRTIGSHDLWFSHYARHQGFKVFVDSGVVCQHLSEVPIGMPDQQRVATTAVKE